MSYIQQMISHSTYLRLGITVLLCLSVHYSAFCAPCRQSGGLTIQLANTTSLLQTICVELTSQSQPENTQRLLYSVAPGDSNLECITPSLLPKNRDYLFSAFVLPFESNDVRFLLHTRYHPQHKPLTPAAYFIVTDKNSILPIL